MSRHLIKLSGNFGGKKCRDPIEDRNGEATVFHNLGLNSQLRGQGEDGLALESYRKAFTIRSDIEDYAGLAQTLLRLGHLYLDQQQYPLSLMCFVGAEQMLVRVKRPGREDLRRAIIELQLAVGEERFAIMQKEMGPELELIGRLKAVLEV